MRLGMAKKEQKVRPNNWQNHNFVVIDFFTATIRNRNTRLAYARACWQFFDWCGAHGLELRSVRPFHVAAWIEDFPGSKPTVKLKLAALRMLNYD